MPRRLLLLIPMLVCPGCISRALNEAAKNITINTPEPLKVEMKVTMDIYRHDAPEAAPAGASGSAATGPANTVDDAKKRKFNRQEEIQTLKNSRLVAETHRGTLYLREKPAGAWGEQVTKAVDDENSDRMLIMVAEAESARRPLDAVQKERWQENVKTAFQGEYIEADDPARAGSYIIIPKP